MVCYLYGDYTFFDLNSLIKKGGDYTAISTKGNTYTFNFCQYVMNPVDPNEPSYAVINKGGKNYALTDDSLQPSVVDAEENYDPALKANITKHAYISYPAG